MGEMLGGQKMAQNYLKSRNASDAVKTERGLVPADNRELRGEFAASVIVYVTSLTIQKP